MTDLFVCIDFLTCKCHVFRIAMKPQNIIAAMLNCSQYDSYRLTYNGDVIAFADTIISQYQRCLASRAAKAWHFSIADHTFKLANPSLKFAL